VHKRGDCFTYFHSDGRKDRHFVAFPPVKDLIKDKLVATVRFYNKYSMTPIVLLDEAFDETIQTKKTKITKFYWKTGMETKPKFHKSGCISYSSLNGHCKIKMNQNRFLF